MSGPDKAERAAEDDKPGCGCYLIVLILGLALIAWLSIHTWA